MKFCPQCRAQYEDDVFFCLQDGTPTVETILSRQPTAVYAQEELTLPKAAAAPTQISPLTAQQETVAVSIQNRAAPTSPQYNAAPQKTANVGLLVGILFGALLVISAAVGGLLYLRQSGQTDETAAVNADKTNQSTRENNSANDISNSDVSLSEGNSAAKTNSVNNAKPSPTENLSVVKVTPSPKITDSPVNEAISEEEETTYSTPTPKPVPKTVSGGVVNGKARNLVQPQYPAAARAVRASGQVSVAVTIDENGNVISASATSGHTLLRASAESAARQSKFSPTMLSGQPVKVTGIIIYNFVAPE